MASSMEWETITIVFLVSCQIFRRYACSSSVVTGSKSRKRFIKKQNFRFYRQRPGNSDPLSLTAGKFPRISKRKASKSTIFKYLVVCSSIFSFEKFRALLTNETFSSTLIQGKSAPDWKTIETSFGFSIIPEVAVSIPPISLKMVDFPQPEGPTKQKNSPSSTAKLTSEMAVTFAVL